MSTTHDSHDQTPSTYEPPRIEQVLTERTLEREVHYAGEQSGDLSDND